MEIIINGTEYIEKPAARVPPKNTLGATHWAELPDGSLLFYEIGDQVLLWLPYAKAWAKPGLIPYTLHCFAEYITE